MKCKHENVRWLYRWHGAFIDFGPARHAGIDTDLPDARVCQVCGKWRPLGPSNDEPPEVFIEICAATWALDFDRESMAGPCPLGDCDVCQARRLSRIIREHDAIAAAEAG